jgi:hypothetical protein
MLMRWQATSHREILKRTHQPLLRQTYPAFCTSAVLRLAAAPPTSVDLAGFPCDNIRYVCFYGAFTLVVNVAFLATFLSSRI